MKMNMDALKALELKLAEYSKENGAIAEHRSLSNNSICHPGCRGTCDATCVGGCTNTLARTGGDWLDAQDI